MTLHTLDALADTAGAIAMAVTPALALVRSSDRHWLTLVAVAVWFGEGLARIPLGQMPWVSVDLAVAGILVCFWWRYGRQDTVRSLRRVLRALRSRLSAPSV